jgi:hypothetical protein
MKIIAIMALLAAGLSVSGCWEESSQEKRERFARELTKCDNCKIDKPFLSTGEERAGGN